MYILNYNVIVCFVFQVSCEKLIIEEEDIAKGLEDLIAIHGITKLVMGTAACRHNSGYRAQPVFYEQFYGP